MTNSKERFDVSREVYCPYCKSQAVFVNSILIYGVNHGMVYLCKKCDAYVGVHKGTNKPLGRLANRELRYWKRKAHRAFDPLWRQGDLSRSQAYTWLAKELGISKEECHIGMFDVELCKRIVNLVEKKKTGEYEGL